MNTLTINQLSAAQVAAPAPSNQEGSPAITILRMVHAALPLLMMLIAMFAPDMAFAQSAGGGGGDIFGKVGGILADLAKQLADSGWLRWIGVIAVAIGGILFTVGELNGPFGYVIRIVAGLAVAVGAVGIGSSFV